MPMLAGGGMYETGAGWCGMHTGHLIDGWLKDFDPSKNDENGILFGNQPSAGWWFGTHILGTCLSHLNHLTHIFQRGRYTTNQIRHREINQQTKPTM